MELNEHLARISEGLEQFRESWNEEGEQLGTLVDETLDVIKQGEDSIDREWVERFEQCTETLRRWIEMHRVTFEAVIDTVQRMVLVVYQLKREFDAS